MALLRMIDLALRVVQVLCAIIVLALTASFLHERNKLTKSNDEPFALLVFAVVISSTSLLHAISHILPHPPPSHSSAPPPSSSRSHPPHAPVPTLSQVFSILIDALFTASYLALFALLTMWLNTNLACHEIVASLGTGVFWRDACAQWNAAQGFSFIAAVAWAGSMVLGVVGAVLGRKRHVGVEGGGGANGAEMSQGLGGRRVPAARPNRMMFWKKRG